jgi:hypothetical protein
MTDETRLLNTRLALLDGVSIIILVFIYGKKAVP